MLYKDEFLKQWDEFQKILKVKIQKKVDEGGDFSAKAANEILFTEKRQWNSPSQYYGIWLNKLKKHNGVVGTAFEQKIGELNFNEFTVPVVNRPVMPHLLIPAIIGVVVYLLTNAFKLAKWQIILSTIVCFILAARTSYSIWENKKTVKKLQYRDIYMQQLESYKNELLKLCEEADAKRD